VHGAMGTPGDQREGAIDRLYALPLDEFTAARDELARSLRRGGEGDAAAEVKRLRKPSVAAWALNQVRRNDPQRVDGLIDAGRRLREAQERLLEGGGREALDRAAEDERKLVVELVRHAEREVIAAGRSVSAAVQEKLRGTLHAVATDPEARELLGSGRLVREHTASGIGPLIEAHGRPSGAAPRERRKPSSGKGDGGLVRKARQLEQRLERARAKQGELDEELSEARRDLREARREAARAASALERAQAAEEQARTRAQQASDRAAELEGALRELQAKGGGERGR
jgi:chromosome segregation ATPase